MAIRRIHPVDHADRHLGVAFQTDSGYRAISRWHNSHGHRASRELPGVFTTMGQVRTALHRDHLHRRVAVKG